jgi:hypothetical protein
VLDGLELRANMEETAPCDRRHARNSKEKRCGGQEHPVLKDISCVIAVRNLERNWQACATRDLIGKPNPSSQGIGTLIATPITANGPSLQRSIGVPGESARQSGHLVALFLEWRNDVLPSTLIRCIREKKHEPRDIKGRPNPQLPAFSNKHTDVRIGLDAPLLVPYGRHLNDAAGC